jgi:hypothetical protein
VSTDATSLSRRWTSTYVHWWASRLNAAPTSLNDLERNFVDQTHLMRWPVDSVMLPLIHQVS